MLVNELKMKNQDEKKAFAKFYKKESKGKTEVQVHRWNHPKRLLFIFKDNKASWCGYANTNYPLIVDWQVDQKLIERSFSKEV